MDKGDDQINERQESVENHEDTVIILKDEQKENNNENKQEENNNAQRQFRREIGTRSCNDLATILLPIFFSFL